MRNWFFIIAIAAGLAVTGCSHTNITRLVEAAAKDPARVEIEVRSPWGTVTYRRDNSAATAMTMTAQSGPLARIAGLAPVIPSATNPPSGK